MNFYQTMINNNKDYLSVINAINLYSFKSIDDYKNMLMFFIKKIVNDVNNKNIPEKDIAIIKYIFINNIFNDYKNIFDKSFSYYVLIETTDDEFSEFLVCFEIMDLNIFDKIYNTSTKSINLLMLTKLKIFDIKNQKDYNFIFNRLNKCKFLDLYIIKNDVIKTNIELILQNTNQEYLFNICPQYKKHILSFL